MLWWTLRKLQSTRSDVRLATLKQFAGVDEPRLKRTLIQLLAHDSDAEVRLQACRLLSGLKDNDTFLPLIEALKDVNDKVRMTAAKAISEKYYFDDRAIQSLIGALKDKNDELKITAARALGKTYTDDQQIQPAIQPLIDALQDKNDAVKIAAAKSLAAHTFDKRAIPHLAAAMIQSDSKTQEKLEEALLDFGGDAVPEFVKMLNLKTPLRVRAIKALGKVKASGAIDSILEAAKDSSDPSVINATIEAIGRLGSEKHLPFLRDYTKDEATSKAVKSALKEIGNRDADALLDFLSDEDPEIRLLVMESLSDRKEQRFLNSFVNVLNDTNTKMKVMAEKSLRSMIGRESFDSLLKARGLFLSTETQTKDAQKDFVGQLVCAFLAKSSVPYHWWNMDWNAIAETMLLFEDPRVSAAFFSFRDRLKAELKLTFHCKESCTFCILCIRHARRWVNSGQHYSLPSVIWKMLIEYGFRPVQRTSASEFPIDTSYLERFRTFVTAMKDIDCLRVPERWKLEFLSYIAQVQSAPLCGDCASSVLTFLESTPQVQEKTGPPAICSSCRRQLSDKETQKDEATLRIDAAMGGMQLDRYTPNLMSGTAMKCNTCGSWICNGCAEKAAFAANAGMILHLNCGGMFQNPD